MKRAAAAFALVVAASAGAGLLIRGCAGADSGDPTHADGGTDARSKDAGPRARPPRRAGADSAADPTVASPEHGVLRVRVVPEDSASPPAAVRVFDAASRTQLGAAEWAGAAAEIDVPAPDRDCVLSVEAEGFLPAEVPVRADDDGRSITVTLERAVAVRVELLDDVTGRRLSGQVEVCESGGGPDAAVLLRRAVDETGTATIAIPKRCSGVLHVIGISPGHERRSQPVSWRRAAKDGAPLSLRLRPVGRLRVRCVDASDGDPVPGAQVSVGAEHHTADAQGVAEFDCEYASGATPVLATAPGRAAAAAWLASAASGTAEFTLSMHDESTLTVEVRDEHGATAPEGTVVTLRCGVAADQPPSVVPQGVEWTVSGRLTRSGEVEFTGLPSSFELDRSEVCAVAPDGRSTRRKIGGPAGGTFRLTLPSGSSVGSRRIIVRRSDGGPLRRPRASSVVLCEGQHELPYDENVWLSPAVQHRAVRTGDLSGDFVVGVYAGRGTAVRVWDSDCPATSVCAGPSDTEIVLEPAIEVSGKVVGGPGGFDTPVFVTLSADDVRGRHLGFAIADTDRRFVLMLPSSRIGKPFTARAGATYQGTRWTGEASVDELRAEDDIVIEIAGER